MDLYNDYGITFVEKCSIKFPDKNKIDYFLSSKVLEYLVCLIINRLIL